MSNAWTPAKFLQPLSSKPTYTITYGCAVLDYLFGSGLPVRSLTEVVGESGTEKTQIGLQLALNVQLPKIYGGLDGNTIFIYTDFLFPVKRLQQLSSLIQHLPPNPLEKIFVRNVHCVDEHVRLLVGVDAHTNSSNVRLIVVDSIASLFRSQFSNTGVAMSRHQNLFFKISSRLKQLAHKFDLVVFITNQVVDVVPTSNTVRVGNDVNLISSGRSIAPALGLSWSSYLNARFTIVIVDVEGAASTSSTCLVTCRRIKVLFAPHLGNPSAEIIFEASGVIGM